ncbi:MAG: helix-turn-helix transcriptional regulator [Candidatus Thiodiazotropha sp.]|nr:helix-turn-helix transcriptional regulator [Candidatus Thiodiazotropha sp.]MCM8882468.1 helix-turn-helix transcriptional regulator [Candidatus Thiodiazotropha sp.]MCM8918684.1 helix-turn-helix transcriptional regulator [Candidatus Thiodiazotropha sp.]MCU7871420.1 helix-turn-helix transcriptional regulator [Candidatus Thiodiazotropha sp. (ex Lucinoma borealis)]
MNGHLKKMGHWRSIFIIVAGSILLIALEVFEDPDLTLGEILIEMIQPTLIVIIAVGMVRLTEQFNIQHETQMLLIKDLETARVEGMQWRSGMSDLIKGLSHGIARQFNQWALTAAEREVGLLILKGMSYKEIAIMRDVSEKTVRQQAHSIYRKAKLSGRAALSAYFLEDLLLPATSSIYQEP